MGIHYLMQIFLFYYYLKMIKIMPRPALNRVQLGAFIDIYAAS